MVSISSLLLSDHLQSGNAEMYIQVLTQQFCSSTNRVQLHTAGTAMPRLHLFGWERPMSSRPSSYKDLVQEGMNLKWWAFSMRRKFTEHHRTKSSENLPCARPRWTYSLLLTLFIPDFKDHNSYRIASSSCEDRALREASHCAACKHTALEMSFG